MSAAISAFSRVGLAFCLSWLSACLDAQELPSGPWKRGAPMPTSRSEIAAAALDGRIYVVGGIAQWGTTAGLEAYDPATDIWQELAPLPTEVHHMAAAAAGGAPATSVPAGSSQSRAPTATRTLRTRTSSRSESAGTMSTAPGCRTTSRCSDRPSASCHDSTSTEKSLPRCASRVSISFVTLVSYGA